MAKDKIYDAIIVGSGASGGMAAKELTTRGLEVLLLEAGPALNPERDLGSHRWPFNSIYRGFGPPGWREREQWMQQTATEFNRHFYVNDFDHPYTTVHGSPFQWIRARITGGRTLQWGRMSYRLSDLDFKAASRDGFGDDWPISYEDLAPYYYRAEEFIGVSGSTEGFSYLPDGRFYAPLPLTCGEQLLKRGAERTGKRAIPMRLAMLTQKPEPHMKNRRPCHYCGNCEDGCDVGAMFNSLSSTLPVAEATGRLTLRSNSIVRQVLVDNKTGKARGVAFVDRITQEELEASAKIIVLGASTLETTRLLFNSKTRQHPNGLGNSSGVLGRYLMDHPTGIGASGYLGTLAGREPGNDDGKAAGLLVPRFRNLNQETKQRFLRGYGFECNAGARRFPELAHNAKLSPGFGAEFKRSVKRFYSTSVSLTMRAEMLPRRENFVQIDPNGVVDAWGIPALRIHCRFSDNELQLARDAVETSQEILKAAGAEVLSVNDKLAPPGRSSHELGTARMGSSPTSSVLNKFNQSWDVNNLFVIDGSAFASSANQNPTLTMLALTIRACEYMAEEYRKGNL